MINSFTSYKICLVSRDTGKYGNVPFFFETEFHQTSDLSVKGDTLSFPDCSDLINNTKAILITTLSDLLAQASY